MIKILTKFVLIKDFSVMSHYVRFFLTMWMKSILFYCNKVIFPWIIILIYLKFLGTACMSMASASRTTCADVSSTRKLNTNVQIGSTTFASGWNINVGTYYNAYVLRGILSVSCWRRRVPLWLETSSFLHSFTLVNLDF